MSSFSSHSNRFRLGVRPQQTESVKSIYAGRHATVNCQECNRIMVPRVVSYYGQPLKSICPFCGSTFMKFPSGMQRFLQRFHPSTPSFEVLKQLLIITLGCLLLLAISNWRILPDKMGLVAFYGVVVFGTTFLAEILFQGIEQLAFKLSHESNYYWATLIAIGLMLAIECNDLTGYVGAFFMIILLRGLVVGLIRFRIFSS